MRHVAIIATLLGFACTPPRDRGSCTEHTYCQPGYMCGPNNRCTQKCTSAADCLPGEQCLPSEDVAGKIGETRTCQVACATENGQPNEAPCDNSFKTFGTDTQCCYVWADDEKTVGGYLCSDLWHPPEGCSMGGSGGEQPAAVDESGG